MRGWKLYGKIGKSLQKKTEARLAAKGYETYIDDFTGVVYYRRGKKRKPVTMRKSRGLGNKRAKRMQKIIEKLFWALVLVVAVNAWVNHALKFPEMKARSLVYAAEYEPKINLVPVTLFDFELKNYKPKVYYLEPKTEVEKVIARYFGENTSWALRCLKSENARHNPYAVNVNRNKTQDIGIFQINTPVHCGKVGKGISIHDCRERLKDVETNVKVAYQIFQTSGSRAWYGRTCN